MAKGNRSPSIEPGDEPLAHAIEMFTTIQNIIGPKSDGLAIPADLILRRIPPAARGPAWLSIGSSTGTVQFDRETLLQQLKRGRIAFSAEDLARIFPNGWIRPEPACVIELPLPDVVASIPPELLRGADRVADDVIAASKLKDLFAPPLSAGLPTDRPATGDVLPTSDSQAQTAAHRPTQTEIVRTARWLSPKSVRDDQDVSGWDGVERQINAGIGSVDINLATREDLEALPGVGTWRAQCVLDYREKHGAFPGIYELLRVPGIGRKLFTRMTGLRPIRQNREDRHERLNEILGFPAGDRPPLGRLVQRCAEALDAIGCILAGPDGILLAQAGLDPQNADRYAAFTPNFFRKTRRYWPLLGEDSVQQVVLPGSHPGALLTHGDGFSWVLLFSESADWQNRIEQAERIGRELAWLFSRRAVVRSIETVRKNA